MANENDKWIDFILPTAHQEATLISAKIFAEVRQLRDAGRDDWKENLRLARGLHHVETLIRGGTALLNSSDEFNLLATRFPKLQCTGEDEIHLFAKLG